MRVDGEEGTVTSHDETEDEVFETYFVLYRPIGTDRWLVEGSYDHAPFERDIYAYVKADELSRRNPNWLIAVTRVGCLYHPLKGQDT